MTVVVMGVGVSAGAVVGVAVALPEFVVGVAVAPPDDVVGVAVAPPEVVVGVGTSVRVGSPPEVVVIVPVLGEFH